MNESREDITVHIQGRHYDVVLRLDDADDVELLMKIIERLRHTTSRDAAPHEGGEDVRSEK